MALEAKLILIVSIILGFVLGGVYLYHAGYSKAKLEFHDALAIANDNAEKKLVALNNQVAFAQNSLNDTQQKIIQLSKRSDDDQQKYDDLHGQYVTAVKRLSVYAYSGSHSAKQDNGSKSSIGTTEVGQTVQLMPDISGEILSFARGYNENLRLKNECIDLYEAVRIKINGDTK